MEPFKRTQYKVLGALAVFTGVPAALAAAFGFSHGAGPVVLPLLVLWFPIAILTLSATARLLYRAARLSPASAASERPLLIALAAASALAVVAIALRW
jgi:hypothetical protein